MVASLCARRLRGQILYLAIIAALLSYATPSVGQGSVVVLAVGANLSFDPSMPKLRYSAEDARRFAASMIDVGKAPASQVFLLTNPTRAELRSAFENADRALRKAGPTSKFVFYFSGHATEDGIHLKDAALSKEELRESFQAVSAQLRLAFLDSCYASDLVRKGIEAVTTFELPRATFDEPSGVVYMTATSNKEVAFESEALRGGVFTHFVLNGLYGRSDADKDGIVTIDELYRYVHAAMRTQALAQPAVAAERPELHVDLHGRGSLAVSFPSKDMAALTFGPDVDGAIYLTRGGSLYRVTKNQGQAKSLQVPAGDYLATIAAGLRTGERSLTLRAGSQTVLSAADFEWKTIELRRDLESKGAPSAAAIAFTLGPHGGYVSGERPGIFAEMRVMAAPARAGVWDLRLGGSLSLHRSKIARSDAHAASTAVTPAVSVDASSLYADGIGLTAALAYGESYQSHLWTYPDGTTDRFIAWAPLASAAVRPFYQWEDLRIGLEARTEVLWGPDGAGHYERFFANTFGVSTELFW